MIIHVVQDGDTIRSISEKYKIPAERLIQENGITNPNNLVIGQTVVIVYPKITYTAVQGDTIASVADKYHVTVMELLRNNTFLSGRDILYPGETIVISYETSKTKNINVIGYTYAFINKETLIKTLPFLTYLTVYNYQYTADGSLIDIHDEEVISLAKAYGVEPIMLLSTLSERGVGSFEVATTMLNSLEVQQNLIDNVIKKVKEKGYHGVNIYLKYLRPENHDLVEEYIIRISNRMKQEGLRIIVTVTPKITIEGIDTESELMDYSTISSHVDGMLFLSYDWSYSLGPPASSTPINIVRDVLDAAVKIIPSEKLSLGLPVIGYDWQLPYIPGSTVARAINYDVAIELALLAKVSIQYNEISAAPYYFYVNESNQLHLVWFKDSRSIDAFTNLLSEYNVFGLSIWNVMRFFAQMWFVINCKYEINKIDSISAPVRTLPP